MYMHILRYITLYFAVRGLYLSTRYYTFEIEINEPHPERAFRIQRKV